MPVFQLCLRFMFAITMIFVGLQDARSDQYSLTDLGLLSQSDDTVFVSDINSSGQVVGTSRVGNFTSIRGFIWRDGVMTDLGDLPGITTDSVVANSINDSGQVAVLSNSSSASNGSGLPTRSFLWDNGNRTDLGAFADGDGTTRVGAINNFSQIAGFSNTASGDVGFLWDNGTMTPLLGGKTVGINDSGQTVGSNSTGFRSSEAVTWDANGNRTVLQSLPGSDSNGARGISSDGQIIGGIQVTNKGQPVLWPDSGSAPINLGHIQGGFDWSSASGINDNGQVVGFTYMDSNFTETRAWVWDSANGLVDLNSRLDSSGNGWTLTIATAINNSGWIVGNAIDPNGAQRGFLLRPVSDPSDGNQKILNGSFEVGDFIGGEFVRLEPGDTALSCWTIGGVAVDWHNAVSFTSPNSGDKVLDLHLDGIAGSQGTISQSFATVPGERYELAFFLAGPGSNFNFPNPRSVNVDIAGIQQVFSTPASLNTDLQWTEHRLLFNATDTITTLQFSSPHNGAGFWGPVLDDVSVSAVSDPGDIDQDGVVSMMDISPFISILFGGDYLAEADLNGDGVVDFLDISPFIALLSL